MDSHQTTEPLGATYAADQWYYASATGRMGPVAERDLLDCIARGVVTLDTLVWKRGMVDWQPCRAVPMLKQTIAEACVLPPPLPSETGTAYASSDQLSVPGDSMADDVAGAHPWRRWGARLVDLWVAALIIGVVVGMVAPDSEMLGNAIAMTMCAVVASIPLEGAFIGVWGRTLGKALFNISVYDRDAHPLSGRAALRRMGDVALYGLALGFPLVMLFTMAHQHKCLTTQGVAGYDRDRGYRVAHGPISENRRAAIVIAFIAILALNVFARTSL